MTTEERLAALEAEMTRIKRQLGMEAELPRPPFAEPPRMDPAPPLSPSAPIPPATPIRPSAEAAVGAYWTTRVGALLVVLAAIFLAAYVSVYSTPLVRVSEMLAAAAAAAGIGYWQERRRHAHFASALHSLGDALLFFTAFASYAFPSMRLWTSAASALGAQGAAALIVCAHAMQRRSPASATFGLALLGWAGGFALYYEERAETLAFTALIAVLGAGWRWRNGWRLPLAWAAVTAPILGVSVHLAAGLSGTLPEVFFGGLPIVLGLPLLVARDPLQAPDRIYLLSMLAVEIVAAIIVGSHAVLVDAVVFLVLAAALAVRRRNAIEERLPFQAGYMAAIAGAIHLALQYHEGGDAVPGVLILGLLASVILCAEGEAVPPVSLLAFWVIAAVAEGPDIRWGVAPAGESHSWWVLAAGVVAAMGCWRWRGLVWWPVAAEVWLHARIAADVGIAAAAPIGLLAAVTAADAAAVWYLAAWKDRDETEAVKGLAVVLMLGALFYGYSGIAAAHGLTFVWIALTLGAFVLGYVRNSPAVRVGALIAFAVCILRLFAADLHSAFTRIVAFFTLGAILIGIGYLYTRLIAPARRE